jgi:hypothetical protein
MADFTASAYIVGGRVQHDINRDHFGDLSTLNVVTEYALGENLEGTPLHFILDWFMDRINKLESSSHHASAYSMNAYILANGGTVDLGGGNIHGVYSSNAVLKAESIYWTGWLADALLTEAFTMNASIRAEVELPVDAVIV